jgi:hypothetical protein
LKRKRQNYGNKKDFPKEIFDILAVITKIDSSGFNSQIYYHIKINQEKLATVEQEVSRRENYH